MALLLYMYDFCEIKEMALYRGFAQLNIGIKSPKSHLLKTIKVSERLSFVKNLKVRVFNKESF